MRGLARLVHPFPSLLVTAVTLAIVPLADPDAASAVYLQLGAAMLLYQFAIGTANDLADRDDDAQSKPLKPLVRGDVTIRQARAVLVVCIGGGLAASAAQPLTAWLVGIAALLCGLVYDAGVKRTPLSWLPLSVALPLVPIWAFTAVGEWDQLLWWTLPLGIVFGAAIHLANQLPDIDADRLRGVAGAAQRAGAVRTARAAFGLFGAAASGAVAILLFVSPARAGLAAASGVVAMMLAPRATRLFGRDGLFGVLAVTTGVIAVVFLSAV